jgi:hypothetical protein
VKDGQKCEEEKKYWINRKPVNFPAKYIEIYNRKTTHTNIIKADTGIMLLKPSTVSAVVNVVGS